MQFAGCDSTLTHLIGRFCGKSGLAIEGSTPDLHEAEDFVAYELFWVHKNVLFGFLAS